MTTPETDYFDTIIIIKKALDSKEEQEGRGGVSSLSGGTEPKPQPEKNVPGLPVGTNPNPGESAAGCKKTTTSP